mgnify:CR=1 FL=1
MLYSLSEAQKSSSLGRIIISERLTAYITSLRWSHDVTAVT